MVISDRECPQLPTLRQLRQLRFELLDLEYRIHAMATLRRLKRLELAVPNRVGHEAPDGGVGIEFWGQSFVVDPAGQLIGKASSEDEEVLVTEVDLSALDTQRTHWPFFRDRRIDSYGDIQKRYID